MVRFVWVVVRFGRGPFCPWSVMSLILLHSLNEPHKTGVEGPDYDVIVYGVTEKRLVPVHVPGIKLVIISYFSLWKLL